MNKQILLNIFYVFSSLLLGFLILYIFTVFVNWNLTPLSYLTDGARIVYLVIWFLFSIFFLFMFPIVSLAGKQWKSAKFKPVEGKSND